MKRKATSARASFARGANGLFHVLQRWRTAAGVTAPGVAILFSAGCLAQRGADFGHWSRTPERIELVRVFKTESDTPFAVGERMLVLPPVGQGLEEARRGLLNHILREIQYASAVHPFQIGDRVLPARYWREDNVADATGRFDLQEVVRIGRLFETRYVLCVHVRAWRPYAPQVLALHMTLVHVEAGERVAELNASFNAAEQQVVVAMDDWLQARRARKYDAQSLDIMLRSPAEFGAFATARCVQSLFHALKKTTDPSDT
jgi:hypothetical protein